MSAESVTSPDSMEPTAGREVLLFVALAAGIGGSTRSLMTVLQHLGPRAHRVFAGPQIGKLPALIMDRGLAEEHLPLWRPGRRRFERLSRPVAAVKLTAWMWRHRQVVTAVHANGPEELNVVLFGARLAGIPVVVWSHARDVSPWMRRLAPVSRRFARRQTIRWAAVSPAARDVLVRGGLTDADEVAIVPNPIDPADVQATHRRRVKQVVVGYLGSDAPYKGFQFLPDVVERLTDGAVRWVLFSDPRSKDNASAWERLRALPAGLVTFAGKVADVRGAYAQCDIVFCPSLEESFCRVAAEAMLNGLPVVASDLPAVRNLLGEDQAGILFPPGDTTRAVDAILDLVLHPERRRALGAAGKVRATSFAPEAVVAKLANLYGVR